MRAEWWTLGVVSVSITVLSDASRAVVKIFDICDETSHTTPSTSKRVFQVYDALEDLLELKDDRPDGDKHERCPDLLAEGQQKLMTSVLAKPNKTMRALSNGLSVREFVIGEEDELYPMGFSLKEPEESEDNSEY